MRRFKLSPMTFFKLLVAAAALALGLAAARLWPRQSVSSPAPPAAVAPARAEVTVRDTFEREEAPDSPRRFEDSYRNYVSGVSVWLPEGVVGSGSAPPAPDHGFGVDLDNPRSTAWNGHGFPRSYLYVDGSYNSLEWKTLDEAADSHLSFLREKGRNVRVRSRKETVLHHLSALKVEALYEEDGVEMVSDAVFAFRMHDGEVTTVYTLALSTPLSKYDRDGVVLGAILDGFYLHPGC